MWPEYPGGRGLSGGMTRITGMDLAYLLKCFRGASRGR